MSQWGGNSMIKAVYNWHVINIWLCTGCQVCLQQCLTLLTITSFKHIPTCMPCPHVNVPSTTTYTHVNEF
jgi:Na+-translocating ferredoxin:NAD+ oxidoreductase RNF subunit RnfB